MKNIKGDYLGGNYIMFKFEFTAATAASIADTNHFATMNDRIRECGSQIQSFIERASHEGHRSIHINVSKDDPEIIGYIKSKLVEAGFTITLDDNILNIAW